MDFIGLNIKLLRKVYRYSQSDLAAKLGITRQQIAHYESGKGTIPLANVIAMSDIFNISIDQLVKKDLTTMPVDLLKKENNTLQKTTSLQSERVTTLQLSGAGGGNGALEQFIEAMVNDIIDSRLKDFDEAIAGLKDK